MAVTVGRTCTLCFAGCDPAFQAGLGPGSSLVLGSDGLWNHVRVGEIARCMREGARELERAATAMIDGARLRSGGLADDTSVVIVDPQPSWTAFGRRYARVWDS